MHRSSVIKGLDQQSTFKGMRFSRSATTCSIQMKIYEYDSGIQDDNSVPARLIYDCRICGHFENPEKATSGTTASTSPTRTQDWCVGMADTVKFAIDKDCIKDPTLQRRINI